MTSSTTGADAVDEAIAQGIDLDGTPIPSKKLSLYQEVMAKEAQRQRSGVTNTMRSRIVRIGAKHLSLEELNQRLTEADFVRIFSKSQGSLAAKT
ncbi:small RNA NsiR4-regulated ssr1528 family protein [Crocosphaera sp. Alani8]|uniref:small RNA NsiR4-regulated ssr1528 family protein n=1 Tax=Crocosphaera sp. Alani8 TaxID=3038952 RepID=UPI00313AC8A9